MSTPWQVHTHQLAVGPNFYAAATVALRNGIQRSLDFDVKTLENFGLPHTGTS